MRRVYQPDKTKDKIDEILTDLYLLKTAIGIDSDEKLLDQGAGLRKKLSDLKDSL